MRRASVLAFSLLLGCSILVAQDERVSLSATIVNDRPTIDISNRNNLPIEAFLVTVDVNGGATRLTRIYYDVHTYYRHDHPIAPGDSKQVPLPHTVGEKLPASVLRAVVFSDGTTIGEQSWVQELLQRRSIVSDRLREVMGLLQNISDENLPKDKAIAVVQHAREMRKQANVHATLEEQALHDIVFYDAIQNLEIVSEGTGTSADFSAGVQRLNRTFGVWLANVQAANHRSR